jgi:hypothetical protein
MIVEYLQDVNALRSDVVVAILSMVIKMPTNIPSQKCAYQQWVLCPRLLVNVTIIFCQHITSRGTIFDDTVDVVNSTIELEGDRFNVDTMIIQDTTHGASSGKKALY